MTPICPKCGLACDYCLSGECAYCKTPPPSAPQLGVRLSSDEPTIATTQHAAAPSEREHIASEDCWCGPELIGDYENEGGAKHYLHKETQ